MMLQRDAFISAIHKAAMKDRDIVFLSADFGAEKLDAFRAELPGQFMHCGISEAHMMDMAAGLSLAGKKVYTYCMGPFVLRAYEQIKCALAMMDRPVTVIAAGVGLGYADAGPTHYVTEDIACLRALNGIEILTPADVLSTEAAAELCLEKPAFRCIRFDREALPAVYEHRHEAFETGLVQGFHELARGGGVCILSSGYMLHRALQARERLLERGRAPGVIDLFRIKPIDVAALRAALERYEAIVTVEEQCLSGGFGSAVLEAVDPYMHQPVRRLGLPDRYYFENGGRGRLLDSFGLSVDDICAAVADFT